MYWESELQAAIVIEPNLTSMFALPDHLGMTDRHLHIGTIFSSAGLSSMVVVKYCFLCCFVPNVPNVILIANVLVFYVIITRGIHNHIFQESLPQSSDIK